MAEPSDFSNNAFVDRYVEQYLPRHIDSTLQPIMDAMGDLAGRDILDVGCGSGWFAEDAAGRGAHVIAIDKSREWIGRCLDNPARNPNVTYLAADAADLSFLDAETFDATVLNMVFINIGNEGEVASVMNEASRVLRSDGKLVFTDIHPSCFMSPETPMERHRYGKKFSYYRDGSPFTTELKAGNSAPLVFNDVHWTMGTYIRLLGNAGMYVEQIKELMQRGCPLPEGYDVPDYILFQCRKRG